MNDTVKQAPARAAASEDYNAMPDDSFRSMVRDWIEKNYPADIRNPPKRLHFRDNRPWYLKLSERGWLCPSWPREYGGMGLSPSKLLIMHEEQERFGCARLNDMGMNYLGPLLVRYGTEAQRRYFLPRILSGEHVWCQGYSEPNAGSDLAALRTSAELVGDEWMVNGQKIWTTLANDANWIFLLVRTDKTVKKQEGISFLLVPLDRLGVTVRPIINLDLHDEFCEVFFDNVRVPKENLVGGINQGWSMAKALLGFERIFLASPKESAYALNRLKSLAERTGAFARPEVRDRYVRFRMELADHTDLYETYLERLRAGETLGGEVSIGKVNQCELYQRITEYTLEVAAEESGRLQPMPGGDRLHPSGLFIQSRLLTIAGGSSEIQRNIIAKTLLGLPS